MYETKAKDKARQLQD